MEDYLLLYRGGKGSQAGNMISVLLVDGGEDGLKEAVIGKDVLGIYYWDDGCGVLIEGIFNKFGSRKDGSSWLINNVGDILFEVGNTLRMFRG